MTQLIRFDGYNSAYNNGSIVFNSDSNIYFGGASSYVDSIINTYRHEHKTIQQRKRRKDHHFIVVVHVVHVYHVIIKY